MTRRLLGVTFAILVLAGLYALNALGHRWRGEWNWTFDAITGSTVITAPLLCALSSWAAMEAHRLTPVTATTRRSRLIPLRLAAQFSAVAWSAYVLTGLAGVVATAASRHGGPVTPTTLPVGLLVLLLAASVGVAAGTVFPFRVSALVSGAGFFLVGAFAPDAISGMIRQGPSTGSLAGLRFDPVLVGLQAGTLLLLALGVQGLLLSRTLARPRDVVLAAGLTAGALVAAVVLTVAVASHGTDRYVVVGEEPTACASRAPRVCLTPSRTVVLGQAAPVLQDLARLMEARGLRAPERVVQVSPGTAVPAGAALLTSLPDRDFSTDRHWAWSALLRPSACAAYFDPRQPPPEAAMEVPVVLEAWLDPADTSTTSTTPGSARWLRETDEETVRAWARRSYEELRDCRLDDLSRPWLTSS